jgi:DNA-binding NarL/FixJ family response regulator
MLLISEHGLSSMPLRLALRALRGDATLYTLSSWPAALRACLHAPRFRLIALDLDVEGCERLTGLCALRQLQPDARLLALAAVHDTAEEREALRIGATAYIGRHESVSTLVDTLRSALAALTL